MLRLESNSIFTMSVHPERTQELAQIGAPELEVLDSVQAADPSPERRTVRLTLYGGLALTALGALVLYLGYNGAATHPQVPAQMPYVISGGFGGAALILLGGILMVVNVMLGTKARLTDEIRELAEIVQELSDSIAAQTTATSDVNGNSHVMALRGGASFHRPGCRLIASRDDIRRYGSAEAQGRGLQPCRVCKPLTPASS